MICMQCGTQNEQGTQCKNCGAALPRMVASSADTTEVQNGRYDGFKKAVAAVKSGEMDHEHFYEFISQQFGLLSAMREDIESAINEYNYLDMSPDEVLQGVDGMNYYEAGIQELSLFVEDGAPEHLDNGLDLIRQGNDCLNDARRINRVERKKLAEEWDDNDG